MAGGVGDGAQLCDELEKDHGAQKRGKARAIQTQIATRTCSRRAEGDHRRG